MIVSFAIWVRKYTLVGSVATLPYQDSQYFENDFHG